MSESRRQVFGKVVLPLLLWNCHLLFLTEKPSDKLFFPRFLEVMTRIQGRNDPELTIDYLIARHLTLMGYLQHFKIITWTQERFFISSISAPLWGTTVNIWSAHWMDVKSHEYVCRSESHTNALRQLDFDPVNALEERVFDI